jgi:hypothetical protein
MLFIGRAGLLEPEQKGKGFPFPAAVLPVATECLIFLAVVGSLLAIVVYISVPLLLHQLLWPLLTLCDLTPPNFDSSSSNL